MLLNKTGKVDMSNQKDKKRIKTGDDSFDIIDACRTIGMRFTDKLSHISVEFRRYKDGDKKCDKREGYLTAFSKDDLPEIIENLARLALTDNRLPNEQFNPVEHSADKDARISTWKMRIQNSRDRQELLSLLRLMVEVGEEEDLISLMGSLGRFVQKHKESNPQLTEKYIAITDEMFPKVALMAEAKFLHDVKVQGNA